MEERQEVDGVDEHSRVLEHGEDADIEDHGQNEEQLFLFRILTVLVDEVAARVVEGDVEHHQQHQRRLSPAVENQVDNKEKNVSADRRRDVVDQQRQRQIGKQKYKA